MCVNYLYSLYFVGFLGLFEEVGSEIRMDVYEIVFDVIDVFFSNVLKVISFLIIVGSLCSSVLVDVYN